MWSRLRKGGSTQPFDARMGTWKGQQQMAVPRKARIFNEVAHGERPTGLVEVARQNLPLG